ncbi:reverse transcriptase domain-containing protein [Tanacetum coccineum]
MYVDGSSASEILYEHCFSRLRSEIKNQFVPTPTPLIGFSDEIIWPIGQIQIPVKIGDEEHSTLALMNFVVVRSPSPYNGIIGRPGVKKLQAVPSTAHGMLKLLVEGGVITLKSSRMVPLECAVDSGPEGNFPATKQAVEERIKLAINPKYPKQTGCSPVRQKKRRQAADRNQAIQEEVGKLVGAGIMKEVYYHDWLSNLVMVKKHDDSWRMCVDFKDLNKAFLKDGYPLPEIDWKISRNLEVYVDDLVIKSHTEDEIVRDIEEMFKTLREINMKLNPKKCTFGIEEGMFLGYKVSTRGLKVCPDKVNAILSLPSPKCLKDVQKLNGKLASLNRFLAKSAEKSLPFFKPLKKFTKKSDFHWIAEAEEAFKQMKRLITELLMLVVPMEKEELIVYLAAAKETVSAVLMTERETKQMSIYFVSRALKGPKVNYTSMEKLVMALKWQGGYRNEEVYKKSVQKKSDFQWTQEAEAAFKQMKKLIAELPMLTAPKEKEELIVYLAAAKEAIIAVLMTDREGKQVPVYFVSRTLRGPEINYTPMQKLVLALLSASKQLKRYFQAHTIVIITDQPIKQLLSSSKISRRMLKWKFELEGYDIQYRPRTAIKGQILADFIMERPKEESLDEPMTEPEEIPEP